MSSLFLFPFFILRLFAKEYQRQRSGPRIYCSEAPCRATNLSARFIIEFAVYAWDSFSRPILFRKQIVPLRASARSLPNPFLSFFTPVSHPSVLLHRCSRMAELFTLSFLSFCFHCYFWFPYSAPSIFLISIVSFIDKFQWFIGISLIANVLSC